MLRTCGVPAGTWRRAWARARGGGQCGVEHLAVAHITHDRHRARDVQAQPQVLGRSCSVHGSTTAPMRKQATIVSTHSGRLPMSVSTTSPRCTPRASSVPARRAERSAIAPKVCSWRAPSRASSMSATASGGAASTMSRVKFMRRRSLPGRLQVDGTLRADVRTAARAVMVEACLLEDGSSSR